MTLLGLIVLNVLLLRLVPSTFFPEQDNGILQGQIIADQSISFQAMETEAGAIAGHRAAGSGRRLGGRIRRRPCTQHSQCVHRTEAVVAAQDFRVRRSSDRLRPKLNAVSGARLFLQAAQDLRIGGRQSAAEYQYTLTSDDPDALFTWVPKLVTALSKDRADVTDVNSDLQQHGLQIYVNMNRATAARYGFAPNQIDNVLYDAFGQRTVSTIYNQINQYFVVMEVAPKYWQYPQMIDRIRFSTAAGNASGTQQTQMSGNTVTPVRTSVATTQASAPGTNRA